MSGIAGPFPHGIFRASESICFVRVIFWRENFTAFFHDLTRNGSKPPCFGPYLANNRPFFRYILRRKRLFSSKNADVILIHRIDHNTVF
jgi:hypothetical protein